LKGRVVVLMQTEVEVLVEILVEVLVEVLVLKDYSVVFVLGRVLKVDPYHSGLILC
jgi:hypothetical protein